MEVAKKLKTICRLLSDLPNDIIANILVKLPTKTILQCKVVCKEFNHIILDPDFAELHYQHRHTISLVSHRRNPHHQKTNHFFMIDGYNKSPTLKHVDYKFVSSKLTNLCNTNTFRYEVINSCRGILLLRKESFVGYYYSTSLRICNPLTNQFKYLKDPHWYSGKISLCGLGYSPRTKEYKVVSLVYQLGTYNNIQVLTLGSTCDQWRCTRGEFDPEVRSRNNPPLALNGFLYWLATGGGIVCFDIEKEEMFIMPPSRNKKVISIGVLHGLLSVVMMDGVGNASSELEFWVMKEYGVTKSWRKYCVIKTLDVDNNITDFGDLLDIRFVEDCNSGMILLLIKLKKALFFMTYDRKEKRLIRKKVRWVNSQMMVQYYAPSFFSLESICMNES